MHISDHINKHRTTFSFEFFPPKSDIAANELFTNIAELEALKPSFVYVTYGAGGGTRELTHDLVERTMGPVKQAMAEAGITVRLT